MGRRTTKKTQLDNHIQKHADDRIQFSLVSDQIGVIDLNAAIGDLFDNLILVYLDDSMKANMKLGKMYEYSAVAFKGACKPEPMYMFAAGVDPESEDLFNFEDREYESIMCYAFPVEKLQEWTVKAHTQKPLVMTYKVEDIDIEELTDMLEEGTTPEEVDAWLREHGATPID